MQRFSRINGLPEMDDEQLRWIPLGVPMNQQYDRNLAPRNGIVPASTQSSPRNAWVSRHFKRFNLLKKSKEVILYAG